MQEYGTRPAAQPYSDKKKAHALSKQYRGRKGKPLPFRFTQLLILGAHFRFLRWSWENFCLSVCLSDNFQRIQNFMAFW